MIFWARGGTIPGRKEGSTHRLRLYRKDHQGILHQAEVRSSLLWGKRCAARNQASSCRRLRRSSEILQEVGPRVRQRIDLPIRKAGEGMSPSFPSR
jgi:hypothetical protein